MSEVRAHHAEITAAESGLRLDQALARLFPDYSRSTLKTWIDAGRVRLNALPCRPRDAVRRGDQVTFIAILDSSGGLAADSVDFAVVHADEDCIVVDKPAGCVVHPGAGNPRLTLANGLLHRFPELAALPRAGLVHRLDKDTSGLLIVARHGAAYQELTSAMAARRIKRIYDAVACGRFIAGGTIDAPIGRDPSNRLRMAVRSAGREAITHYRITTQYRAHTRLEVHLETGRTHQIRVHFAHLGHPLVGDVRYGARVRLPHGADALLADRMRDFVRPALHARRLEFEHPAGRGLVQFESATPPDLLELIEACERDCQNAKV